MHPSFFGGLSSLAFTWDPSPTRQATAATLVSLSSSVQITRCLMHHGTCRDLERNSWRTPMSPSVSSNDSSTQFTGISRREELGQNIISKPSRVSRSTFKLRSFITYLQIQYTITLSSAKCSLCYHSNIIQMVTGKCHTCVSQQWRSG